MSSMLVSSLKLRTSLVRVGRGVVSLNLDSRLSWRQIVWTCAKVLVLEACRMTLSLSCVNLGGVDGEERRVGHKRGEHKSK